MTTSKPPADSVADPTGPSALPPALVRELIEALRSIRYGAIELIIHDGHIVQLERREKVRLDYELTLRNR